MSSDSTCSNTESVTIEELKDRMCIVEYNGFSLEYRPMNDATCEWIQLNFKGSQSVVNRSDKEITVPVIDIQKGDYLIKINNFPKEQTKLTQVNQKLITALKQHGFNKFLVLKSDKKLAPKKEQTHNALEKAYILISKLKESIQLRDDASHAVENMFDNARNGKINTKEIQHYAEKIIADESVEALTAIISLKESDQTYTHCIDVGAIFYSVYTERIQRSNRPSIFKSKNEILVAAFLHDIGKSRISKDILDSPIRYKPDSQEMKMIRAHPGYSATLLKQMKLSDYIVNMAHYHHVKFLPGLQTSYPPDVKYEQLLPESRLLSIVDIFQALVGKRLYKTNWVPPAAIRYLNTLSDVEFDRKVWNEFVDIMGLYPVGSLIKLTDNSTAFVIGAHGRDPGRPQVAVIKDRDGQELNQHTFIDLEEIRDLSIAEELDPHKTLGQNKLNIFENLNLV